MPFVYLVLTGGFPYTVVMLGLVTAWLGIKALAERRVTALVPLAAGWIGGLGLSAPAWLSLLQAMQGSGREAGVGTGNAAWTLPLSSLPGLILPNWTTSWHNFSDRPTLHGAVELAGAFVPAVGLIAGLVLLRGRLARPCRWDLAKPGGLPLELPLAAAAAHHLGAGGCPRLGNAGFRPGGSPASPAGVGPVLGGPANRRRLLDDGGGRPGLAGDDRRRHRQP